MTKATIIESAFPDAVARLNLRHGADQALVLVEMCRQMDPDCAFDFDSTTVWIDFTDGSRYEIHHNAATVQ